MFSIAYTKSFKVKPNSIVTLTPNLIESFSTLWSSYEILRVVNIIHDILCITFSIFYHSHHIWYHEILTNLMIFRLCLLFLEFKNHSTTRSWSYFLNKMFDFFISQIRPQTGLNNVNIIFLLILFYYLNHLRFKFDLHQKIPRNAIN